MWVLNVKYIVVGCSSFPTGLQLDGTSSDNGPNWQLVIDQFSDLASYV